MQPGGAQTQPAIVTDSPIARFLFGDVRLAWLWLPLRLYVGWTWLQHGLQKAANPAWTDSGIAHDTRHRARPHPLQDRHGYVPVEIVPVDRIDVVSQPDTRIRCPHPHGGESLGQYLKEHPQARWDEALNHLARRRPAKNGARRGSP